jgi:hypothetical protein
VNIMEDGGKRSIWGKFCLGGITLSAALALYVAAPAVRADSCQDRVIKADHNLHDEAAKHGWDSPQANKARAELNSARSWCWDHEHKWWDEDAHAWRTEHWDEHDHDHPPH